MATLPASLRRPARWCNGAARSERFCNYEKAEAPAPADDEAKSYLLDFPTVNLGYAVIAEPFSLDVGIRGGLLLKGRHSLGDDYNRLDARRRMGIWPEAGAGATVALGPVMLDTTIMRVFSSAEPGTPVDLARGLVCLGFAPFGICVDVQYVRSDVTFTPGQTPWMSTHAWYGGITVGFGAAKVKGGGS